MMNKCISRIRGKKKMRKGNKKIEYNFNTCRRWLGTFQDQILAHVGCRLKEHKIKK